VIGLYLEDLTPIDIAGRLGEAVEGFRRPAGTRVSIETAQSSFDCAVLRELDGKQVMVGCLDLNNLTVEAPETIVERIKPALPHVRPEDVILAPDCGMKYLPPVVAFGKMTAMVAAAKRLRPSSAGASLRSRQSRSLPPTPRIGISTLRDEDPSLTLVPHTAEAGHGQRAEDSHVVVWGSP